MVNQSEKIKALKKQLKSYSKKDEQRLKAIKDKQRISLLKKQIREKKYASVVQAGKEIGRGVKGTWKGAVKGYKAVDKGLQSFVGENPIIDGKRQNLKEVLRKLPS